LALAWSALRLLARVNRQNGFTTAWRVCRQLKPPTEAVLSLMEGQVSGSTGTPIDAAVEAMKNPSFYNVTLKNFVAPWTNREQNVFVPLNDYIATVIGMIKPAVVLEQQQ
jgi:hypothetical protein